MAPDQYFELLAEIGVRTYYGYGMTECPMICQGSPDDGDEELANTVGTPIPGLELCIVREDGTDAAPSEHGEIHVKGPMVCRGYTDESATTAAFDDAGWFRTGDLGVLRPDGRVVITVDSRTSSSARVRTSRPRRSRTSCAATRRWRTSR